MHDSQCAQHASQPAPDFLQGVVPDEKHGGAVQRVPASAPDRTETVARPPCVEERWLVKGCRTPVWRE